MNFLQDLFLEIEILELNNSQLNILLKDRIEEDSLIIIEGGVFKRVPTAIQMVYSKVGEELFSFSESDKKELLLFCVKFEREAEKVLTDPKYRTKKENGSLVIFEFSPFKQRFYQQGKGNDENNFRVIYNAFSQFKS